MRILTLGLALAALALPAAAQAPASPPVAAPLPVSVPPAADVATPEAAVQAIYAVISGPAGQPRDWARMRGLLVPGGMLMATGSPKTGGVRTRVLTVEDYIAASSKTMETTGFYEHGVAGHIWRYAHIATVTSPYESRHAPGEAPFARGINVFELMFDGTRWWVASIYWEGETPGFPLPPEAEAQLKAK